jgi:hypothetical protein
VTVVFKLFEGGGRSGVGWVGWVEASVGEELSGRKRERERERVGGNRHIGMKETMTKNILPTFHSP